MQTYPNGSQLLFYPMKNSYIGAGFKNPLYATDKNHLFTHYGVDYSCYTHGIFDIFASGNGTVLGVEKNTNSLGHCIVIKYEKVYNPTDKTVKDYIFRYMHLVSCNVVKGTKVVQNTKLGTINSRHQWYNHLHLEIDADVKNPFHTPQVAEQSSLLFIRAGANDSTMIDPVDLLVMGNKQTAILHPLAKYVTSKDTPNYKESDFSNSVIQAINNNYQKLILPINQMRVTAGYKNPKYETLVVNGLKMGKHYGLDCGGSNTIYGSGNGTVLQAGYDSVLGNVVIVKYEKCFNHKLNKIVDVVLKYHHLAVINVKVGDKITSNTRIGVMGNTGKYSTAMHLHLEADTDIVYYNYTPTISGNTSTLKSGYRDSRDTTFNPMEVLHCKTSAPDKQSIARTYDGYTSDDDIAVVKII